MTANSNTNNEADILRTDSPLRRKYTKVIVVKAVGHNQVLRFNVTLMRHVSAAVQKGFIRRN